MLEERFAGGVSDANKDTQTTVDNAAARVQWLWDVRYVDAPVLRWRDTDSNGSLDETLYYCNDANMNVTALVSTSGAVVERYLYDPYGKVSVYDGSWSAVGWANSKQNEILYCGYRFDTESGLYHVRHRYYHPTVGRWMNRDSIGNAAGMHLYSYSDSAPSYRVDPWGTQAFPPGWSIPRPIVKPGKSAPEEYVCYVCGPDITDALVEHLNAFIANPAVVPRPSLGEVRNQLRDATRGNSAVFRAAADKVRECPIGDDCQGTVTICDRCISMLHIDHILVMSYLSASFGPHFATAAGRWYEGVLGNEDTPSDLAMNDVGVAIAGNMAPPRPNPLAGTPSQWTYPPRFSRDYQPLYLGPTLLTREALCQSLKGGDWGKITQKPAFRSGSKDYAKCAPCTAQIETPEALKVPPRFR